MESIYTSSSYGAPQLFWKLDSPESAVSRNMLIIAYSAIAQAASAGGVLLIYTLWKLGPGAPQWCKPFAQEEIWRKDARSRRWGPGIISLSILPMAGFGVALANGIMSRADGEQRLWKWLELLPWAIVPLVTFIERPRKTPKTLLILYCIVLIGSLAALYETYHTHGEMTMLNVVGILIPLAAVLVILAMPMRDPSLDTDGIAKSHDASTVELRSPEDNLTLWEFMTVSWMSPLIKRGFGKRLDETDVWQLPYDFQHERLHSRFKQLKGSIVKRLLVANGLDLMITTGLGISETAANLANPILLRCLLTAIKEGNKEEAMLYTTGTLAVRLVACQSAVFLLWFSRRAYERSRGEMITAVYAKTLTRKTQAFQLDEDAAHVNGNSLNGDEDTKMGRLASLLSWCAFWKKRAPKMSVDKAKAPATMGKILNLMRSDCYEVSQRFWEFPTIVTKPLQVVVTLILVWGLLGWPCLLGVGWVILVQLLNAAFVNRLISNERLRRAATDVRLQATSQFVEAIRHLRWYDWQSKWLAKIMDARKGELRLRVITQLWSMGIVSINAAASALFPVFSFFAYTYFAHKSLPVELAFPALQLFSLLEASLKELPQLITVLLNAFVAVERLEAFLDEPDKEDAPSSEEMADIEFFGACFAWPGTHSGYALQNLNLKFSTGINVVCGKVGAGKTALLQAILGEMDKRAGHYSVPSGMFGYCAQSPWLQNMSIRENILFCAPYDPVRYKQVLDACALTPDLAYFKHGDLSSIGENGIGLSGGQKARVALARAVYSQARILLLDDPIAPLDHNTATTIVTRLFKGHLVEGRTVVLVTHRVDLCSDLASQVVEMNQDGRARVLNADDISRHAYHTSSPPPGQNGEASTNEDQLEAATQEEDDAAVPDKFVEDEHRASGGVAARVYWTYIKAGLLSWWSVLVLILMASRLVTAFNSWFLKAWGEAYPAHETSNTTATSILSRRDLGSIGFGFFSHLPNPEQDVDPWLMWYFIIAMMLVTFTTLTQGSVLIIIYMSARNLFVRVINKVANATFRFYDVTPVGRLMNRLTSDIGMLDGGMIYPLQSIVMFTLTWLISMAIIASTTPLFFAFAIAMTIGFVLIFRKFLPSSQSLRRLEFVSLSPLMSNFGILLDGGLATIRAFRAQPEFQHGNIVVVDAFQQMDHFYWSLQAWLMYRFDSLSAVSTFVLTLVALNHGLSAGMTAFVLAAAAQFVDATHGICKVYGQLQMDFVSVERVVELVDIEEEKTGHVIPSDQWPKRSDAIFFENVTLRYAPQLDPVLQEVSFTIPGGSTCAVLGRTGSGKSTLALALLGTIRPDADGGRIRVGDVDIAQVDVHLWRQRISFVAQDPVLFPGTLRQNLDPLEEHTDADCLAVLHRILGKEYTLTSHVEGGGKNLSQGQRQLVGIGRAVLRRSPVVVLDEATASIDKRTAMAIQDVLREELRESTVVTIAHRLEAVKDADFVVRLEKGRVVEAGPTLGIGV